MELPLRVSFEHALTSLCNIAQTIVKHDNYKFPYTKKLLANNWLAICQAWLLKFIDETEKPQMTVSAEPELFSAVESAVMTAIEQR